MSKLFDIILFLSYDCYIVDGAIFLAFDFIASVPCNTLLFVVDPLGTATVLILGELAIEFLAFLLYFITELGTDRLTSELPPIISFIKLLDLI